MYYFTTFQYFSEKEVKNAKYSKILVPFFTQPLIKMYGTLLFVLINFRKAKQNSILSFNYLHFKIIEYFKRN